MYKMLIAEDESKFSDFLKNSIDWNDIGVEVIAVCTNGEDALNNILKQKPDIVLVDMKMPRMNGLELIKRIREEALDVKFVAISGYNDFNTVKEAFKQGVVDYVLKAELDPNNIKQIVKKIIESKRSRVSAIKEKYLRELIWGARTFADKANDLQLRIQNKNLVVLVLNILNYEAILDQEWEKESELFKDGLVNLLEELLELKGCGEVVIKRESELVFLFSFSETSDISKNIEEIAVYIMQTMYRYLGVKTAAGYAGFTNDAAELKNFYESAKLAAAYTFVTGRERIVFYQDEISKQKENISKETEIQAFETSISNMEFFQILSDFERFIIKDISIHNFKDLVSLYEVYFQIILRFANKYKKEELVDINKYKEILLTGTLTELNSYFYDVIFRFKESFEEYGGIVFQVQKYVQKNYFKNITVEQLADEFNINYKKLSRLFLKQTGIGLKKYIIKFRMEEAMCLITTTDYFLYEIAEMLGYLNYESFSKSFYNYFGKWPKEIDRESSGGDVETWRAEKK